MFFLRCMLNTLKQINIFLVELMNRLFYNTIHQSVCYCWMTVTVIMNCHFSSLFFEEKTISDLLVSVHFWVSNNFWNITEFFFSIVSNEISPVPVTLVIQVIKLNTVSQRGTQASTSAWLTWKPYVNQPGTYVSWISFQKINSFCVNLGRRTVESLILTQFYKSIFWEK